MGILDRSIIDNGPLPSTIGQTIETAVTVATGSVGLHMRLSDADGVTVYIPPLGYTNANITTVPAANTLLTVPLWSGGGGQISEIGFSVAVVGAAGSLSRCGLYDSDPVTLRPRTLLADSGQIDTNASTGFKNVTGLTVGLQPHKLYYPVFQTNGNPPTISGFASGVSLFGMTVPLSDLRGWSVAQAFGALPATFPGGAALYGGATAVPLVVVRFSSYNRV